MKLEAFSPCVLLTVDDRALSEVPGQGISAAIPNQVCTMVILTCCTCTCTTLVHVHVCELSFGITHSFHVGTGKRT